MAIDMERLLAWTYFRQQAHSLSDCGLAPLERALDGRSMQAVSADGIAALMSIGELGYRIGSGWQSGCTTLPQDAETVHRAVMARPTEIARLIIQHAASLGRPDAPRGHPVPGAVLDARGRPKRDYDRDDKGRNYGWCLVRWAPDPIVVEGKRTLYRMWHAGVTDVAYRLMCDGELVEWRIDGFRAAARPWV